MAKAIGILALLGVVVAAPFVALAIYQPKAVAAFALLWAAGGVLVLIYLLAERLYFAWLWQLPRGYKLVYCSIPTYTDWRYRFELTDDEKQYAQEFAAAVDAQKETEKDLANTPEAPARAGDIVLGAIEAERQLAERELKAARAKLAEIRRSCPEGRLVVVSNRKGDPMLALKPPSIDKPTSWLYS